MNLPPGWCYIRVSDVIDDHIEYGVPENTETFIYLDISSVDNQKKRIVAPKRISRADAPSRARQQVRTDDVLVATTRPNLNAVATVPADLDGSIASTGFVVLRSCIVEPEWLFAVVQSKAFIDTMAKGTVGALYPAIRPKDVYEYVMPLPPLDEQRRIISKLRERIAKHESLVNLIDLLRTQVKDYRVAVVECAATGELSEQKRDLDRLQDSQKSSIEQLLLGIEINDTAPTKKAEEDKASTISGNEVSKRVLPSGWKVSKLGDLIQDIETGKSFQTEERPSRLDEWGIIKVSALSGGVFDEGENKAIPSDYEVDLRYEIHPGDLLVCRSNTPDLVGATVFVEKCRQKLLLSDKSLRLVPYDIVDARWIQIALSTAAARSQMRAFAGGTSGSMVNISQDKLKLVQINVPPYEQQQHIIAEVNQRIEASYRIEAQLLVASKQMTGLRFSINHEAVSGSLVPQEAYEESASVLLQKIQAFKVQKATASTAEGIGLKTRLKRIDHSSKDIIGILKMHPDGLSPEQLLRLLKHNETDIPYFYRALRDLTKQIAVSSSDEESIVLKAL